ncbi:MAG: PepSY domain-containing protein [Candidatus Eremiobacteraeota bacterium]|nr:PepSY domain-containing protein [Candidatus Eremiobacteraeota bacterium]MCW5871955.1 PepSY domain-containing protein [Candidatus Eremiobacteraeota bacterium]
MRKVHRLLGLVAGLWLVWLGLTGSLLALGQRLDQALHPHLFVCAREEAPARLQEALLAVRQAYPGRTPERLDFGRPLRFWLDDGLIVYVDPAGPRLLGDLPKAQTVRGCVLPLHEFAEPFLPVVAGLAALVLFSGWSLQKPTRRALPPRHAYDWHRVLGWLSTPSLLVAMATGTLLVEYKLMDRLLRWGQKPAVATIPNLPDVGPDLDAQVGQARRIWPQAQLIRLQWTSQGIQLRLRQPGEHNPVGRSFLHLEPATGKVTTLEDPLQDPWAVRLLQGTYGIHAGYFPGGGLLAVLGLTPLALWLTGLHLRRKRLSRIGP